jgi:hypothetical protein
MISVQALSKKRDDNARRNIEKKWQIIKHTLIVLETVSPALLRALLEALVI